MHVSANILSVSALDATVKAGSEVECLHFPGLPQVVLLGVLMLHQETAERQQEALSESSSRLQSLTRRLNTLEASLAESSRSGHVEELTAKDSRIQELEGCVAFLNSLTAI